LTGARVKKSLEGRRAPITDGCPTRPEIARWLSGRGARAALVGLEPQGLDDPAREPAGRRS
jgi:hypothetical protein